MGFKVHTILKNYLYQSAFRCPLLQRSLYSTEADLLDLFHPKEPAYYRELIVEKENKPSREEPKNESKKKDVIISCHRPEFNHYRNQKYDKFKPIPLASKGWHHNKSIGDHFSIRIFNQDYDIGSHFWDENVNHFNELPLSDLLIQALGKIGVDRPTKIQVDSIPVILSGKNTLIAAETGCGKTLAYLIPVIQKILAQNKETSVNKIPNSPLAVVVTPSRELAVQIGNVVKKLFHHLPLTCDILVGGRTKQKMLHPTFKNMDILVASLGALCKMTSSGIYNMKRVRYMILDESDTLLDDSFNESLLNYLKKIKIRYTSDKISDTAGSQLILASATFPDQFNDLLADIVETTSVAKVTSKHLHKFLPHIPQTFYRAGPSDKPTKLLQLVKKSVLNKEPTMIFSNKSSTCDWISLMLNENGVPSLNLNGEMPRIVRSGKFDQFLNKEYFVLSCTDIASRGMDTQHVKHVINYDFPLYMADYIHRCGRTGRCGSDHNCHVTNFVSGLREVQLVNKIEMAVRTMDILPNVNGNITNIIQKRIVKYNNIPIE